MPTLVPRDRRLAVTPAVLVSAVDAAGFPFLERTHAVDVSGTGLCFDSAHALPAGAAVSLTVMIPRAWQPRFRGKPVYSVRGVVRRCERRPADGRFRVAVRFTGDDNTAARVSKEMP